MQIDFHRTFRKQFKKLPAKMQEAFERRISLFAQDPFAPELNNHSLWGEWKDCRSININGDVRAIYIPNGRNVALFLEIGTHHELYGS